MKAEPSRLIPRKLTENLELVIDSAKSDTSVITCSHLSEFEALL